MKIYTKMKTNKLGLMMAAMFIAGYSQVGLGQNSSYHIIKGQFSWSEAKSDAENRGGHLAVITSQQEQNVINNIVKSASTYLWLGGASTGGEWKWITGENWNYTNWSFNEPSNDGAYLSIWANESVTNRDLGTWNDSFIQPSSYRNGYLLEMPPVYQIVKGNFTWTEAKLDAEKRGGHLATFTDEEEKLNVYNDLDLNNKTDLKYLWVGARKINNQPEWITGEDFVFSILDPNTEDEYIYIDLTRGLQFTDGKDERNYLGYVTIGGYILQSPTYSLIKGNFTWTEAKLDAEKRGGHLATITSKVEQDIITALVSAAKSDAWIGGTDEGSEGNWKWITGESWGYQNWDDEEPNGGQNENHLNVWGTSTGENQAGGDLGTWNDFRDYYRMSYIFEIPTAIDSDGDGLYDDYEIAVGTDPNNSDSDGDGLSDNDELFIHKTNPNRVDTDQDGLSDKDEIIKYSTSPIHKDTDSDGLPDGIEIAEGFDPLVGTEASDGELSIKTAVELEFFTLKSQRYQLQWSVNLNNWNNDGLPFKGVGGFSSILKSAEEAGVYWRLKVVN